MQHEDTICRVIGFVFKIENKERRGREQKRKQLSIRRRVFPDALLTPRTVSNMYDSTGGWKSGLILSQTRFYVDLYPPPQTEMEFPSKNEAPA